MWAGTPTSWMMAVTSASSVGSANGPFTAELHKNCAVVPTSLGGSSYVGMPLDIRLSNEKELGTVTIADGVPTFTKTGAAG